MKKQCMLLILALALLPALVLLACGKSPTSPSTNPSGAPPPPVVVCTPQYPPTLTTGWTMTNRGGAEVVLRESAAVKVTFAWSPPTAHTGVFVAPNVGYICPAGSPCSNALASDFTTNPSPKVIQTGQLNPGSYIVWLEPLDAQGVHIEAGTVVEICK